MKRWMVSISLIVSFLLPAWIAATADAFHASFKELRVVNKVGQTKYVPDEVIVKYKGDTRPFRVIKVSKGKVKEKIKEYMGKKNVIYAEPNYYAYALFSPDDPYYKYQWDLDNPVSGSIQTEEAWDISTGKGVTVAVVDTGIAQGTDLADTCLVSGYDFVNDDSDPTDDNGHGTHVAGTIAQSTNNSIGVAGVAFGCCLMPVKVLDSTGAGTYADVADGIYWATDNGANVINLSLGGSEPSDTIKDAVAYAYDKGVTVVAAIGNEGSGIADYPAAYDDYVIAVGATRYDETLAYYSNYGPSLDLVAPGGDLDVDQNGDGYGDGILQQTFQGSGRRVTWGYYFFQGTSMAAPHVSGVAALVIANGNASKPDDVRAALEQTATDLGDSGRDNTYGYGLVNAYAALGWSATPGSNNPPASELTTMHVEDIAMPSNSLSRGRWAWYQGIATVTILDSSENPVEGATVEGDWSGLYSGYASGITDANGEVTFETDWIRGSGTFTFTVDNVTKEGWTYNSSENKETSNSITVP